MYIHVLPAFASHSHGNYIAERMDDLFLLASDSDCGMMKVAFAKESARSLEFATYRTNTL